MARRARALPGMTAVRIGVFVVPGADDVEGTLAQALAAEEAGLDLVAIQDHPYQRRFLDTWALLAVPGRRAPSASRWCRTWRTCRCARPR